MCLTNKLPSGMEKTELRATVFSTSMHSFFVSVVAVEGFKESKAKYIFESKT